MASKVPCNDVNREPKEVKELSSVLIVTNNMQIGGIQKSLANLLKQIHALCNITLFCIDPIGVYMDSIPDDVRVITGSPTLRVSELSAAKARGMGFRFMLLRAIFAAWTKLFGKGLPAWILTAINGAIDGQYDLAVSFSQPIGDFELCALSNEVVLRCANARKKATFLHCDFSEYGGNTKRNRKLLSKFDWIAAVSDGVRDRFCTVCPELAEKTRTVLNCIDCEEVIELSLRDPVCYTEAISLVTVARLAPEKGLLRCIQIIKKLRDCGMDICWHIVGGGPCEAELMESILHDNASSCVQMHGQQLNPYRYMKNADFLFVPSFHEAAPIVFNEARCLGLPIITTDTLSAQELVVSLGGGVSCINTAEGIETLLIQTLKGYNSCAKAGRTSGACDNGKAVNQFMAMCKESIWF